MIKLSDENGRILILVYFSMFLISLCMGSYNPLVPLYAEKMGATYLDLGVIGAIFAVPHIFLPLSIGGFLDKFGRKYFYFAGIACSTLGAILLVFTSNLFHIALVRLFGGIAYSLLWPSADSLISDVSSMKNRTRAMGLFSFSFRLDF